MKRTHRYLAALAAAAVLLSACGSPSSGTSSSGSSQGASGSAGSADSESAAAADWKVGLALHAESEAGESGGEISTVAAVVLLDGDGRIRKAMVDELEGKITAGEDGAPVLPEDLRTKRQKGDEDYPLQAVSEIGRGWADQADAFADHIEGMTAAELARLETDEHGRAADPDLLAGCTIAVDRYRDAVAAACEEARPIDEGGSLTRAVRGMVDGLRGR